MPDIRRNVATVRGGGGNLWQWQVLCLESGTQESAAPVSTPGCLNGERHVSCNALYALSGV